MTIADLREICLAFPGVTEDIKWGEHLCFNVGSKMFIITSPDSVPVSASFKTTPEDFDALSDKEGFIPAPYLARNKWIYVDDINRLNAKNWERYLQHAYELIASKLSLKIRKQLTEPKRTTLSSKTVGKRKKSVKKK